MSLNGALLQFIWVASIWDISLHMTLLYAAIILLLCIEGLGSVSIEPQSNHHPFQQVYIRLSRASKLRTSIISHHLQNSTSSNNLLIHRKHATQISSHHLRPSRHLPLHHNRPPSPSPRLHPFLIPNHSHRRIILQPLVGPKHLQCQHLGPYLFIDHHNPKC
jgi:hypothetical protein